MAAEGCLTAFPSTISFITTDRLSSNSRGGSPPRLVDRKWSYLMIFQVPVKEKQHFFFNKQTNHITNLYRRKRELLNDNNIIMTMVLLNHNSEREKLTKSWGSEKRQQKQKQPWEVTLKDNHLNKLHAVISCVWLHVRLTSEAKDQTMDVKQESWGRQIV